MVEKLNYFNLFRRLPPFHLVDDHQLKSLLRQLDPVSKTVRKGERVFRSGEAALFLHILAEGVFQSELITPSGKVLSVQRVTAPEVVAAPLLFAPGTGTAQPDPESGISIRAVTDGCVAIISKRHFLSALTQHEDLLSGFLEFQSGLFLRLSRRMQFLVLGSIKKKIALFLLELSVEKKREIILPISQSELADHFAVERPSLAAVLKQLDHSGIIQREGGRKIRILDFDRLEEIVHQ